MVITNYQIIQRDKDGFAEFLFAEKLPDDFNLKLKAYVCVFRESDNLRILEWTQADICEGYCRLQLRLPEGGLYRIEVCMAEQCEIRPEWQRRIACIRHIGVGDVFVIAGQSNMAGYGRDFAYDPPCLGVHLYGNNGKWDIAAHPLNDSTDTIYSENAEYVSGTSPALSFGRRLKEMLGVPIGLVQTALGGSLLERWNPAEEGSLYRAMLRRMEVVGKVKAVLWYQGCSDAVPEKAPTYLKRFVGMVKAWREEIGPIPFITVQLNRWHDAYDTADQYWGMIKEAQRVAENCLPDVCVVPSYDVGMSDGIHNSSGANVILGERMALASLKKLYHQSGRIAPSVERVEKVDDTHIRVLFQKGVSVVTDSFVSKTEGMHVEDQKGIIDCIKADMVEKTLILETNRAFTLPARYHAYWQCKTYAFPVHETGGMPMLACYGVNIESED